MDNFVDQFIAENLESPENMQPDIKKKEGSKKKSIPVSPILMMPKSNPHAITLSDAAKYLNQWKLYKSTYYEFLKLSKNPSNYINPSNNIYTLRDNLLKYELIDMETFMDLNYIKKLSNLLGDSKKIRILNGIKTIGDIQKSQMDLETQSKVINYLLSNCKDKIECFIIMTFDK